MLTWLPDLFFIFESALLSYGQFHKRKRGITNVSVYMGTFTVTLPTFELFKVRLVMSYQNQFTSTLSSSFMTK